MKLPRTRPSPFHLAGEVLPAGPTLLPGPALALGMSGSNASYDPPEPSRLAGGAFTSLGGFVADPRSGRP